MQIEDNLPNVAVQALGKLEPAALARHAAALVGKLDDSDWLVRTAAVKALPFHNSAPHHYWGLYFFRTAQLRSRCQVAHATQVHLDFDLGRNVRRGKDEAATSAACTLRGWNAAWRPPAAGGECNATQIEGYDRQCPQPPPHASYQIVCHPKSMPSLRPLPRR